MPHELTIAEPIFYASDELTVSRREILAGQAWYATHQVVSLRLLPPEASGGRLPWLFLLLGLAMMATASQTANTFLMGVGSVAAVGALAVLALGRKPARLEVGFTSGAKLSIPAPRRQGISALLTLRDAIARAVMAAHPPS